MTNAVAVLGLGLAGTPSGVRQRRATASPCHLGIQTCCLSCPTWASPTWLTCMTQGLLAVPCTSETKQWLVNVSPPLHLLSGTTRPRLSGTAQFQKLSLSTLGINSQFSKSNLSLTGLWDHIVSSTSHMDVGLGRRVRDRQYGFTHSMSLPQVCEKWRWHTSAQLCDTVVE